MMMFSWSFAISYLNTLAASSSWMDKSSFQHAISNMESPTFGFSNTWSLLGPFQIGTREAAWGADPLEYYGGFPSLKQNDSAKFKSSLAPKGTITWSSVTAKTTAKSNSGAKVSFSVNYSDVDWTFLQAVYGWAALQWQGWARGAILINATTPQTVTLYTDHVLEYAIDGIRHFGGDFYAYRKSPLVLTLDPGKHVVDLRLVRDVRAMGGVGAPTIDVDLEMKSVASDLEIGESRVLVADVVDGRLAAPYGSVTVRNNGKEWIEVFGIIDAESSGTFATSLLPTNVRSRAIAPGQTRPIPFHLTIHGSDKPGPFPEKRVALKYFTRSREQSIQQLLFTLKLESRSLFEPHKVTYLHPGGIVSYAMLRPPSRNATCSRNSSSAPVLLQFHGAGLEADNGIVAHALDPVPDICAWVLYPTGVTPWSGDDWHNWGFADVEAAVAAIPPWIQATGWPGIGVDTESWFVSGHSNGGQGTWYALTHYPDKVFAAAPVSGYLSIHAYVPYQLWRPMDPRRRAVIEASANSYRHELLASNAKYIPILQQHGSADDNVPAYHSRLMSQLLWEAGWPSNYSELAGKGHWFDTVMTTDALQKFYKDHLTRPMQLAKGLTEFELVVANPSDMGSKAGVRVLYLKDPGRFGKLQASIDRSSGSYSFRAENILAFEIKNTQAQFGTVVIDGQEITMKVLSDQDQNRALRFWKKIDGIWTTDPLSSKLRKRSQLGGIDAMLRSQGPFRVNYHGLEAFPIALQISRNLFQYFSADSEVTDGSLSSDRSTGNVITLTTGSRLPDLHVPGLPDPQLTEFPIRILTSNFTQRVLVRHPNGILDEWGSGEGDLGLIFVRPSWGEALELVIWGRSAQALAQAARLAPLMTGIGQPDFVILESSSKWKGVEGTSLGFFDAHWNVTESSVFSWSGQRVESLAHMK